MAIHIKTVFTVFVFLLCSCSKPQKDFSSYESATRWVRATHEAEVMKPDSSTIHRVEYFPDSEKKWLVLYFKSNRSKGYLYQNFPQSMWVSWKNASSKGKWYHRNLKGKKRYFFYPSG